jgi:hypothetical protein
MTETEKSQQSVSDEAVEAYEIRIRELARQIIAVCETDDPPFVVFCALGYAARALADMEETPLEEVLKFVNDYANGLAKAH